MCDKPITCPLCGCTYDESRWACQGCGHRAMSHEELRNVLQFMAVADNASYGLDVDEAASLLAEYDRLRAENAELRNELGKEEHATVDAYLRLYDSRMANQKLRAENAELRKLVQNVCYANRESGGGHWDSVRVSDMWFDEAYKLLWRE